MPSISRAWHHKSPSHLEDYRSPDSNKSSCWSSAADQQSCRIVGQRDGPEIIADQIRDKQGTTTTTVAAGSWVQCGFDGAHGCSLSAKCCGGGGGRKIHSQLHLWRLTGGCWQQQLP